MKRHITLLKKLGACSDAVAYAENFSSLKAAWLACERGDWLLWFAGKCSGEPEGKKRKTLVLASCACARLALPYTKDARVRVCIETAERWANGKAAMDELMAARNAADTAYAAAYAAAAASSASSSASSAASSAYAAAYAAASAAAYAAADAASASAAASAAIETKILNYGISLLEEL